MSNSFANLKDYVEANPPSEPFFAIRRGHAYRTAGTRLCMTEERGGDLGYGLERIEHMDYRRDTENFAQAIVNFMSPMLSISDLRAIQACFQVEYTEVMQERDERFLERENDDFIPYEIKDFCRAREHVKIAPSIFKDGLAHYKRTWTPWLLKVLGAAGDLALALDQLIFVQEVHEVDGELRIEAAYMCAKTPEKFTNSPVQLVVEHMTIGVAIAAKNSATK